VAKISLTAPAGYKADIAYRLGIICTLTGMASSLLLILACFPRYMMGDLLDALHWTPPVWLIFPGLFMAPGVFMLLGFIALRGSNRKHLPRTTYFAIAGMAVMLAGYFCFPLYAGSTESGRYRHRSCLGNQRQIMTTMMMFAQDHDMKLPATWDELGVDKGILVCPTTDRYFHRLGGYGLNMHRLGAKLLTGNSPEDILVCADAVHMTSYLATSKDIDARHRSSSGQNGFIAGFVDGHVNFMQAGMPIHW